MTIREAMTVGISGANLSSLLRFGLGWGAEPLAEPKCRSEHVSRLLKASDAAATANFANYKALFDRWKKFAESRANLQLLQLRDRMQIGLGAVSVLDTNVTLHPLHGYPFIPGPSIKGALRAHFERKLVRLKSIDSPEHKNLAGLMIELFGSTDPNMETAGAMQIHDAWWVPSENEGPLVREIDTPHHSKYYTGAAPLATDFDDPVPINQVAVRGAFLFAIDYQNIGKKWASLCMDELSQTLVENGLGGRTFAAGYGRFKKAEGA